MYKNSVRAIKMGHGVSFEGHYRLNTREPNCSTNTNSTLFQMPSSHMTLQVRRVIRRIWTGKTDKFLLKRIDARIASTFSTMVGDELQIGCNE